MALAFKSYMSKGVVESSSVVEESCRGQICSKGFPEKLLCEAVKMKPGLHWRPHHVGGLRNSAKEICIERMEPPCDREVYCKQQS